MFEKNKTKQNKAKKRKTKQKHKEKKRKEKKRTEERKRKKEIPVFDFTERVMQIVLKKKIFSSSKSLKCVIATHF